MLGFLILRILFTNKRNKNKLTKRNTKRAHSLPFFIIMRDGKLGEDIWEFDSWKATHLSVYTFRMTAAIHQPKK